jgi:hypothetical protein
MKCHELQFIFIDGAAYVAIVRDRNERSIILDLYRNMDDLRSGKAMERSASLDFRQLSPAQ